MWRSQEDKEPSFLSGDAAGVAGRGSPLAWVILIVPAAETGPGFSPSGVPAETRPLREPGVAGTGLDGPQAADQRPLACAVRNARAGCVSLGPQAPVQSAGKGLFGNEWGVGDLRGEW